MPAMPDATQVQPEDETTDTVYYASFILRCWTSPGGQIRVRLIDVQSSISRPVADLADLAEQVRCLMARGLPSCSPESPAQLPRG
jgi:hypothetical protein